MKKRSFIIGSALMLLLAGTAGSDEVRTIPFSCNFAGTFADGVETNIDTNNDGASAGLSQALENCNTGRAFVQEVAEYQAQPLPTVPESCPGGTTFALSLVQAHGVATNEQADQVFTATGPNEATLCFKESDGTFSVTAHGTITGGTGALTGASGTFDAQSTGKYLVFGFKNGVFGGFGQFSGTATGTLILPNGGDDGSDDD
jgi:hypothetical protein